MRRFLVSFFGQRVFMYREVCIHIKIYDCLTTRCNRAICFLAMHSMLNQHANHLASDLCFVIASKDSTIALTLEAINMQQVTLA